MTRRTSMRHLFGVAFFLPAAGQPVEERAMTERAARLHAVRDLAYASRQNPQPATAV